MESTIWGTLVYTAMLIFILESHRRRLDKLERRVTDLEKADKSAPTP